MEIYTLYDRSHYFYELIGRKFIAKNENEFLLYEQFAHVNVFVISLTSTCNIYSFFERKKKKENEAIRKNGRMKLQERR